MRDDLAVAARTGSGERAADARRRTGITFEDMAARRAERMVNLVLCLLSTRAFLTAEQIRRAVPGYEPDDHSERADEAFKRMFERDKAELRELGIPLETGRTSIFDVDDGYRIARRDYELPEIEFDPAEATAVGLAARLWQSATLSSAARTALLKLRAAGVEVDDRSGPGTFGPLDAAEPALGPLLDAVRERRAVRLRLPQVRRGDGGEPRRRAVGRAVLAGSVVPRRPRSRPQRRPQLPAVPPQRHGARGGRARGRAAPGRDRPAAVGAWRHPDHARVARVRVVGPGAARLRRTGHGRRGAVRHARDRRRGRATGSARS